MASPNAQGLGYVGAGAAIGSIIPGVGTAVGAGIGAAIGGIAGSIGLGKKAKKSAKKARQVQQEREQNAQNATYLQMIRQARLARSGSLAASTAYGLASSSLATSALSSIGSQSQYSVQYTANDQRLVQLYNRYMKKAGDYAKAAQTTLAAGQLASLAIPLGAGIIGAGMAGGSSAIAATAVGEAGPTLPTSSISTYLSGFGSGVGEYFSSGAATDLLKTWGAASTFMQPIYTGISQYNQI